MAHVSRSETTVMKVLNHPNMIKLIETIETKTTIYIVTEIVKDEDLFEYIVTREFLEGRKQKKFSN